MKFGALALDYDGTIATDGRLDSAVRETIGELRQGGIAVILVTGRRLADLHRVAGDLTCFDAIVGENGAVLEFPASGRHMVLSHPPAASVVDELRRRHVELVVGESVMETDASGARAALDVLRSLEQPLVLAFNRSRLMILPQAVAKSTGLRHALRSLGLSIHNTVGIGDAENDHDLLDACEVGVAVAWGSPALKAVADEIVAGDGPGAVATYLRRLFGQPRLSAAQMGRRRVVLGREHNGEPIGLAIRGRTILIAGEPGTGKSWLAGLICEQLILQGYSLCIIDPEGDYRALEALPGVVTLGGEEVPPQARELERSLRHSEASVIVDLSALPHSEKRGYLGTLLPFLVSLRRRTGLPHKILLDEAHYFLTGAETRDCVDPELSGYILVTYRVSALDRAMCDPADTVVLVTRETDPVEAETLFGMCGSVAPGVVPRRMFGELATNEAALLPGAEEAHGVVRRFRVAPRLTAHVRHQVKYLDMPVADARAFVFSIDGRPGPRARTLKAFTGLLAALPGEAIEGHLNRHDFSRWIDGVFRDSPLASHVRLIESRVQAEEPRHVAEAVAQAIRARYDTAREPELVAADGPSLA